MPRNQLFLIDDKNVQTDIFYLGMLVRKILQKKSILKKNNK